MCAEPCSTWLYSHHALCCVRQGTVAGWHRSATEKRAREEAGKGRKEPTSERVAPIQGRSCPQGQCLKHPRPPETRSCSSAFISGPTNMQPRSTVSLPSFLSRTSTAEETRQALETSQFQVETSHPVSPAGAQATAG